ncbi:FMRFamide-related peptides-like [Chelonus insularis]|uniref:FMRFamide-related peptides-like n=1 Tax=Chelonus insularis TaxID=460826 RepID=UPI001588C02D|nr:FMRFamide-related peptides-like [Chelonus insularis]
MIRRGIIFGLIIVSNSMILSATILSPLKIDPTLLHLYKSGLRNELDYVLKRSSSIQNVDENPDSKERRSQMGSSFIRFGRGHNVEGGNENPNFLPVSMNEVDTGASRTPRGRSDVIIRFGRSGLREKLDNYGLMRGKKMKIYSMDLERILYACPDILASADIDDNSELIHLCSSFQFAANNDPADKNKE